MTTRLTDLPPATTATVGVEPGGSPVHQPGDVALVRRASGLLADFNRAGVLRPADVHTAQALGRMGREDDERVLLALALTVRALRNGSVAVDLQTVSGTVFDEAEEQVDVSGLPWPEPVAWADACASSTLVVLGADGAGGGRPLRLHDGLLYLERYWQQEELVRVSLQERFTAGCYPLDRSRAARALHRLFPRAGLADDELDLQQLAAAVCGLSRVTVIAGGPGTGKTPTVARHLARLRDQPGPPLRVALAAPTGKAAARLEEAVRSALTGLDPADRERVGEVSASTLHRLLGWQRGSRSRFRHDATNHLPHDVLVVDETSMVSLTMMARLLEAVRPDARLVLVGDPDQLSSVEAGAVLADVVRAPGSPSTELGDRLAELALPGPATPAPVHGIVQLTRPWRYGGAIDELARAVRASDPDRVMAVLRSGATDVGFCELELDAASGQVPGGEELAELSGAVREAGRRTRAAAAAGDAEQALAGLDHHRLLCAHRRGPYGVTRWSLEAERWLVEAVPGYAEDGEWYLGRPLMVTANDYEMSLYNGDTGVVVHTPQGPRAAFARGAAASLVAPVRLDAVQTVHAMTVHRAQGSQFRQVSFVVPPPDSPLLTRELLYTAVTRATDRVLVLGTEEAVRRAVQRPALRASGLRHRLGGS